MTETTPPPLLAAFGGREPDRPAWFTRALEHRPERLAHTVDGARIETLTWGEVGRPGLLLLHGKMAHADWWSFIAPHFATTHRVVALSFSGMGGSDWRDTYSTETMATEALAVAQACGLFEGPRKPVIAAHSFGAFAGLLCAERAGSRLGGVITIDMPLLSREMREKRNVARTRTLRSAFSQRPTRVYATLADALARFRFAPPQPCENLFIADHIARTSLKQVTLEDESGPGWTWRFDPRVAQVHPGNPAHSLRAAACPIAITWGGDSALVTPAVAAHVASLAPADAPKVAIPAARHHVMVDQPLAFVSVLQNLLSAWPAGT